MEVCLISGSLIKENCHNPRTSDNIDMKLETVSKLDKRNEHCHRHFSDLWPVRSNLKFGIRMHNLENLTFH